MHASYLQQVLEVLSQEKLYGNLEKCHFTSQVMFLGYVASTQGIHVDESKIKAIQEWPTQTSIQQVRSFDGLASFYMRFVWNFSSVVAPMTEVLKWKRFGWKEKAQTVFEDIKSNSLVRLSFPF